MANVTRFRLFGCSLRARLGLRSRLPEPGGVGDPCIPEDEYQTAFTGYGETEVNVESRSFQCETRVCLVNHFRGRVSCPYGQSEADLANPRWHLDWPLPRPRHERSGPRPTSSRSR